MNNVLLRKYAEFVVKVGVNPQKGQNLIIRAPIEGATFARLCAETAYTVGVKRVIVHYTDEQLARLQIQNTAQEDLCHIMPWEERKFLDYVEDEGGACLLSIIARNPEIYKGLDEEKVDKFNIASSKSSEKWRSYTMSDKIQWCIAAIPSPAWAAKVYDNAPNAEEKLWQAIFDVCRVTNGEPVSAWQEHVRETSRRRDILNNFDLHSIHITSDNGTDLDIQLADGAIWEGASSTTPEGYEFIANIPTEEIFTAPHRLGTNGVVKGTKPYVYNGSLIENFSVTFKDGKVIAHSATNGEELLGRLLDTDEGARHIGEIALVPASSPINRSGLLFYNTLFDENAACHIAFGQGYPGTIHGGKDMSVAELLAKGVNDSLVHEDVMIGARDTKIIGKKKDGTLVNIFTNGEWAF